MPNPPLYLKLVFTACLSVLAIVLHAINPKSKARRLCMFAMLLCTVGDVFMTNSFKIDDMVSTIIGAVSFMGGHVFYAWMFYQLKEKRPKIRNLGSLIGIIIGIVPIVVIVILGATLVPEPKVLYLCAVPVYVLVITMHIAMNFSYSFEIKSWRSFVLVFAVVLFYVTDIWIFLYMFGLAPKSLQDCVWYFYPIAQLLLILFCAPTIKEKSTQN